MGVKFRYVFKLTDRTVGIQHTVLSSQQGIKDTLPKENYYFQQLKETDSF